MIELTQAAIAQMRTRASWVEKAAQFYPQDTFGDSMPPVERTQWSSRDVMRMALHGTQDIITHDIDGNRLGDYHDARRHGVLLYYLASNVNWVDPREVKPQTPPLVLEIGVRHGVTTLALLAAMQDTGGLLVSLDIDAKTLCATKRRVDAFGLAGWWLPLLIPSHDFSLIMGATDSFDMIWVDGDHTFDGAKSDIADFMPHVRQNGVFAMHDMFATTYPDMGVRKAVEGLLALEPQDIEHVSFPWSCGIEVIRRKVTG